MTVRASTWNLERILILLCILLSAGMLVMGWGYPEMARRLPVLVAATVLVLSVYLLLRPWWAAPRGTGSTAADGHTGAGAAPVVPWWQGILLSLLFLGIAYGFGFGTGLLVFTALFGWRLRMRPLTCAIFGITFSVTVYVVFQILLGVSLSEGAWLHLY